jgi:phosphatidylglycerophosphatase A
VSPSPVPGGNARHRPLADRLGLALASLGPLGSSPLVPATVASAVLALVYAFLPALGLGIDLGVAVVVTAVAVWAAGLGDRIWGHDAKRIVIDEAAGMAVTLCLQPAGWPTAVLAFLAFRFFDVWKPFPARRAERLPGGVGVVLDDVIAGLYANLGVRLAARVLSELTR